VTGRQTVLLCGRRAKSRRLRSPRYLPGLSIRLDMPSGIADDQAGLAVVTAEQLALAHVELVGWR
jgi:hypothetical protein